MDARAGRAERDIRLLFAIGGAAGAAILPFFVLLLRDRGLKPDATGVVLGAQSLAAVLAGPAWTHLADTRFGSVRVLQVSSLVAAAAALALLPTGSNLLGIALLAAVLAAASAPGTALIDTLALATLGPGRMTEYGSIRLWSSIGWAVAVLGFGWWFERSGLGPVLPAYAVGTIVFVLAASRLPSRRPGLGTGERSRLGSVGAAFREAPRLRSFLVGLLLVNMAAFGAASFVPLRIAAKGGGPFLVGLAACVAALVEVPLFRASSRLVERFGLRRLYAAGCGVYVATMLGYALVSQPAVVAAIRAGAGAGFGLTYAALVVITGRLVPERLRNTGQALMQVTGMGVGPILGQAAGGLVYRHLGPPTLFASAAALIAVGTLVVWRALSGAETA